jgi:xanthine dehydrogenase YagT iron-sulfur-binding subunit
MPEIRLTVNGEVRSADVPGEATLLEFLRDYLRLTGTKSGCEEGVCGTCTVHIDGRAVRSCLVTAVSQAGKQITTIEGLASGDALHPVQKAFLRAEAFQCGYCTPGMIMEAAALLHEGAALSATAVARRLQGHICRCGMYNEIVQAVVEAAREVKRG